MGKPHTGSHVSHTSRTSRRRVIVIAGSAVAASILPRQSARADYPMLSDTPPPDEGFFFILPGKKGAADEDREGDRIFFISSSWLPLFEVTDHLSRKAKKGTVNIAAGTPALVTWSGHGLENENKVRFIGSGALPNPMKSGETYFVKQKTANNFKIADKNGTLVNTTDPGTATAIQIKKSETLNNFRSQGKAQKDWLVLYSDDIPGLIEKNTTAPVVRLPDPPEGKTYLAMSIK
jgi:hypothetical protein